MFANRHVRYLLGLVLGGCAGLSLTVSVLPVVLRLAGVGDELVLTRALAPLAPWAALLWAAGGLSAVRAGSPLAGAVSTRLTMSATVARPSTSSTAKRMKLPHWGTTCSV